jgi:hypothetical protein
VLFATAAVSGDNRCVRLRVRYHRPAELVVDHAAQLSRGGLLVRVDAPEVERLSRVTLALELADVAAFSVRLEAEVVQTFPGVGVAVTFAPTPELEAIVEKARALDEADEDGDAGDPAEHVIEDEPEPEEAAAATNESTPAGHRPVRYVNPMSEKVNAALKGTREDRIAIMRENLPQMHLFVLKNPGIQLDEVAGIAKMRTVTPEVLKQIADRREWAQRPDVAAALARNPKTPMGIAIRMLDFVSPGELRQLAKDNGVRQPIMSAARKKVIG